MADKTTSQTQQSAPGNGAARTSMLDDTFQRMEGFWTELSTVEKKGADRARQAIDEYAKLMKATLDYNLELSSEWRRLALESTRRCTELFQPKA